MFARIMFCEQISTFSYTIPSSFAQYLRFQFLLNLFFLPQLIVFFSGALLVFIFWVAFYLVCSKLISISWRHARWWWFASVLFSIRCFQLMLCSESERSILREKNCNFAATHLLYATAYLDTSEVFIYISYRLQTRCHAIQSTFRTRKFARLAEIYFHHSKEKKEKKRKRKKKNEKCTKKKLHSSSNWLFTKQSVNNLNECVWAFSSQSNSFRVNRTHFIIKLITVIKTMTSW